MKSTRRIIKKAYTRLAVVNAQLNMIIRRLDQLKETTSENASHEERIKSPEE